MKLKDGSGRRVFALGVEFRGRNWCDCTMRPTHWTLQSWSIYFVPPTDLYEHKIHVTPGTKPWKSTRQYRWPPHEEYWLQKIVNERLACGMYEKTLVANSQLWVVGMECICLERRIQNNLQLSQGEGGFAGLLFRINVEDTRLFVTSESQHVPCV